MIAPLIESEVQKPRVESPQIPTVWGLQPHQLHDRYWASHGVQAVRAGRNAQINAKAELYLLIEPNHLVLFDLHDWIDLFNWTKPDLLILRLQARKNLGYREIITGNDDGDFLRFERRYKACEMLTIRVGLTCDRELAEAWSSATNPGFGWRKLRAAIPPTYRETRRSPARIYRRNIDVEVNQLVQDLVTLWNYPGASISRANKSASQTWTDPTASVSPEAQIIGPVWIGAGRMLAASDVVVGPAILWDDRLTRPEVDDVRWADIEPASEVYPIRLHEPSSGYLVCKRIFDVVFSLFGLLLTLPLYPFILLAIYVEDGRPFFFMHERETVGGRVFRCLKFRSMRKNAAEMTAKLQAQNQADGPQFFIDNDPRITRVGLIMRKNHLDELPQFINVLLGHMSVVGPRPSPRNENQCCPEWRETRLSVRPGITGLWQLRRTRLRGRDFQEWIKYDIQYVENMGWMLDCKLIWQTVLVIVHRTVRS